MSLTTAVAKRLPIKRLFKIVNGATPSSAVESYWNGNVPWVTPEDLGSLKSRTIVETRRLLTEDGLANCGASMVPARSLILSTRAPIGHLAIAAVDCCTNQGCKALVPLDGQLDSYFYYQLIAIREILQSRGRGSTFKELSTEDLSQVKLWCPTPPNRKRIAAYLDRETARIDALVAEKEALLRLLEEKRASLISHAVTRGLNPKAKLKPSGIPWLGDVPEHWEVKELRHITAKGTKITYGIVQAGPDIPDGIPYIRTSDMSGDFLPEDGYQKTSVEIDQSYARSRVYEGDMVISIRASVGKTLAVPGYLNGANLTQGTAKVSPGERIVSRFLFHWMNCHPVQRYLGSISKGTTFKEITLEMLRRTPILVPPMEEQEEIVQICDRSTEVFRELNKDIQTSIQLLREKRTSLISAAVTGEMAIN